MLNYIRCPSCGKTISYNLDKYQNELSIIRNNPKLTTKEKEIPAAALLNKYGLKRICCRIRIMGLIPYHEIVIT